MKLKTGVGNEKFLHGIRASALKCSLEQQGRKLQPVDFSLRKFQQADFFTNNSFIFTTAVLFFSFKTAGCHWD